LLIKAQSFFACLSSFWFQLGPVIAGTLAKKELGSSCRFPDAADFQESILTSAPRAAVVVEF
jgi:hypothetical protein